MSATKEQRRVTAAQMLHFALTLIPPLILFLVRPLGMTAAQAGTLAALVLTILWWVTGPVPRTAAALFLLGVFLLFSGAPVKTVFSFPLSENFLMIVFSFLFSQGVANSGLVARLVQPLLVRFARTPTKLLLFMLLSSGAMVVLIPQPFSRIILLSLIYWDYFAKIEVKESLRFILMLGLYFFSILINMAVPSGDIILNGALLTLSGGALDAGKWFSYMTIPTLIYLALGFLLFRLLFRGALKDYRPGEYAPRDAAPLTPAETRNLVFLLCVVLLWATEPLHGISGTLVVAVAVAAMFPLGLLRLGDFRSVNVALLVFLTAAFSIGGTLKTCGVADKLFSLLLPLFPSSFGLGYCVVVLAVAAVLHMLLGSNVTTLSVVVPGLLAIGAGTGAIEAILFLAFLAVCGHFMLPFHSVILLLGEGRGYFSMGELFRLAVPHTVLTAAAALLVYLPYWRLMGLI